VIIHISGPLARTSGSEHRAFFCSWDLLENGIAVARSLGSALSLKGFERFLARPTAARHGSRMIGRSVLSKRTLRAAMITLADLMGDQASGKLELTDTSRTRAALRSAGVRPLT